MLMLDMVIYDNHQASLSQTYYDNRYTKADDGKSVSRHSAALVWQANTLVIAEKASLVAHTSPLARVEGSTQHQQHHKR